MTIEEIKQKYKQEIANACLNRGLVNDTYYLVQDSNASLEIHCERPFRYQDSSGWQFWNSKGPEFSVPAEVEELCNDWDINYAKFKLIVTAEII